MKIIQWIFVFQLITAYSFSQVKISGRLINEKGDPVPYATVGLKNAKVGSASNEQGFFQLYHALSNNRDTLTISCIGYKNAVIPIESIADYGNALITLQEFTKVISGITVKASDKNAAKIVEKALSNYRKNYTRKKYELKGFYRQLMRNDSVYVLLTEGAFSMQDRGYGKRDIKRLRLDALRKSDDMRNMDSLDIHYDTLMEHNDLMSLFKGDFIDATSKSWSFYSWPSFNSNILKSYDFLLDGITLYNNEEVYEISFFSKSNLKYHISDYKMFIRRKDYALIEMRIFSKAAKITSSTSDKRGNISRLVDGQYYHKKIIQYQEYNGKWFPKYISTYGARVGGDRQKSSRLAYQQARANGDNNLVYTGHELNGRLIDPDQNNYFEFKELLITEIRSHKQKFQKIRERQLMDRKKYIRNHELPYSEDFWKRVNTIPMNPYLIRAKKHLISSDQFQRQF
ncbi:MAG: carboxypeptidase-like regulatory domain-containing protein [Bacteroidota bacterium]